MIGTPVFLFLQEKGRGIMISKLVSGGQTGVDQASLSVALDLGIPCGGWCPKGRLAENGLIPMRFPLLETPSRNGSMRTEWNVRDSDGTLILSRLPDLQGGTKETEDFARDWNRPCLVFFGSSDEPVDRNRSFLVENRIGTLNVAGPRASEDPEVGEWAYRILLKTLSKDTRHTLRHEHPA